MLLGDEQPTNDKAESNTSCLMWLLFFTPVSCLSNAVVATLLQDGYSQIFRSYVHGPLGIWTMAPLPCKIGSLPFLGLPQGGGRGGARDQILISGNTGRLRPTFGIGRRRRRRREGLFPSVRLSSHLEKLLEFRSRSCLTRGLYLNDVRTGKGRGIQ